MEVLGQVTWERGDRLWFYPGTSPMDAPGADRLACRVVSVVSPELVRVKLRDGRQVCIVQDRVSSRSRRKRPLSPKRPRGKYMSTSSKPTVRELRRSAKSAGVSGWEDMSETELAAAVKAAETKNAKKASTRTGSGAKKAAAAKEAKASKATKATKSSGKKASTSKASNETTAENGNPFKEGTNMYLITEQLIKGGKRSKMVATLKKQIDLQPRSKAAKDFDVDYEMDRRILITGQLLRNQHGFEVTREGRGADATIVAVAP